MTNLQYFRLSNTQPVYPVNQKLRRTNHELSKIRSGKKQELAAPVLDLITFLNTFLMIPLFAGQAAQRDRVERDSISCTQKIS